MRRFDGKIDDDAWLAVEPYSTFTQTDPIEGAPATERTEVRILFDKATVYIGVIGFDSEPDKIIVNQSRRDADLTETDAIIFVFDTFNDNQNAFVFGTNPLGIEYDGQASGEGQTSGTSANLQSGTGGSQRGGIGSFNASWDGDWRVKASITERGWEAEIAIPLKTLRYATGSHGHRRARREVGNPAESHRGFHGQHRFRAGGSRRGTGQPDAVRPLLPYYGLDDNLVQTSMGHFHFFEIQPKQGGRFGTFFERYQDRPIARFTVFNAGGTQVVIPPGFYTW